MDLSIKYLGYTLKNPIIVGSSGLTNSVDKIKKLEANNAGAVVLKSLFEEQIISQATQEATDYMYPEAYDYVKEYSKSFSIDRYLKLIETARKEVKIPVIASINARSNGDWVDFAKRVESAGSHGIELNVSILPTDEKMTCKDVEQIHLKILENVKKQISIPISVKISSYSSGLSNLVQQIAWSKTVESIVMFNRFYNPDIDINKMEVTVSNVFSSAEDLMPSLRWIAMLAEKYKSTSFVASTGVYTGEDAIKQILVGADAVQVVSAIYKHGEGYIGTILNQIKDWMKAKKFHSITDFKGKMSLSKQVNQNVFERVQFMKYYGNVE
ncbi:MAG: dihydroorotate dehydrogenase-like protein [Bacteroidales bacterium]|nr:dihydroorotate dehydrogenase-like protein [Bacteroidales bacterium]